MLHARRVMLILVVGLVGWAGCSQQQTASEEPRILEETVALTPSSVPVTVGPLAGELSNLSVTRRVNDTTGEVVYQPQFSGTLVLRNTSEDQAVQLIGGRITYLGADRAAIKPASGREDTAFTFPAYVVERLDPGQEMSHTVDVPFPAAVFAGGLRELRLAVEYLPMPYRADAVTVGMEVGARS